MREPEHDPEGVVNWLRLDQLLTTSGQPGEQDLARLARGGVRTVINLGLHSHEQALPDERATVEALGMTYIHIPVPFDAPGDDHFAAFCAAMAEHHDRQIHVHCIMNYRVSAFLYRWRRERLGWHEAEARTDVLKIWDPWNAQDYPAWRAFVERS